ncbi:MAG TPA: hypothetical protein PK076_09770 [Saprospiraceae bacterium]|nr:hypothetical protein [Saprospiraceae bacterium]HQW56404.1 hypothetical protein [Saprospiraceae bacterium]
MRIIFETGWDRYKITCFVNAMKYSLKIETNSLEIIYKMPETQVFDTNEAFIAFVNAHLEYYAKRQFTQQELSFHQFLEENLPREISEEEII